jgi:hypothetical protein
MFKFDFQLDEDENEGVQVNTNVGASNDIAQTNATPPELLLEEIAFNNLVRLARIRDQRCGGHGF